MTDSSNENENVLERLTKDVDEAGWDLLAPHHEREALFLLDKNLDLPAVGFAMYRDDVQYIQKWLTSGELSRPTDEQINIWKEEEIKFHYLIVQPYVLIKLIAEELQ
jgi:hypothetical protein